MPVLVILGTFLCHLAAQETYYCFWNRKLSCSTDHNSFILNQLNPVDSLTLFPKRYNSIIILFFTCGTTTLMGPRPLHCWSSEITHRHTAFFRTPLEEGSAQRRGLYVTTHNTHKRQTSMISAVFEPAIPPSYRPRPRDQGNRQLLIFIFPHSHRFHMWSCTPFKTIYSMFIIPMRATCLVQKILLIWHV
jgi:hypothetical protein